MREFAEYFHNKYKERCDPKLKNDIIYLTLALILNKKSKFDEALMNLNKVSLVNYQIYLISKQMQIYIYYSLKQYEAIIYLIDNANHYLRRKKKIIGLRYNIYISFFSLSLKLVKIDSHNIKQITDLKNEITSAEINVDKAWFIKKIGELEQQYYKNKRK